MKVLKWMCDGGTRMNADSVKRMVYMTYVSHGVCVCVCVCVSSPFSITLIATAACVRGQRGIDDTQCGALCAAHSSDGWM